MRHNKKINHLGRTASHRNAMLANMSVSLIRDKRIFTTVAKAKALKKIVEPIITKSKVDTTHSRRLVFQDLKGNAERKGAYFKSKDKRSFMFGPKEAVTELFQNIAPKVANRPGGYTRIIKTGNRLGDNAAMCFIELVDFNDDMNKVSKKKETKTRTRRSKKTSVDKTTETKVENTVENTPEVAE